ncbi:MAG: glycerol-3-phosphate 1-O-acyltransferase PlsY [Gammaproteobacteria bacterium]|nr:glycerol-3-phosphate 1-O-acyltransferase PlsY [Gammaproteobacteria bacterium]
MINYLLPIAAYLIGSISSAVIVSRFMGLPDPRTMGSKNPGATNVLRTGNKRAAAFTLIGDVLKGVVAVVLTRALTDQEWVIAACGLFVFLGHLYPVFLRFRGGKGVATGLGVYLALSPWLGLFGVLTWVIVAAVFRYSSLGSLLAASAMPIFSWFFLHNVPVLVMTLIMAAFVVWRHRENIKRIATGNESRIKLSRS